MNLIHALLGEHGVLRDLLAYCENVARHGDERQVRAALHTLERLLLNHADQEETLLFPLLAAHGHSQTSHSEHEEIASWIKDDAVSPAVTLATATDLARLHFEAEEERLFPWVLDTIPEHELLEAGERWVTRRQLHRG